MISLQTGPKEWRFWDFAQNDRNAIEAWYTTLAEDARNHFRAILKNNRKVANPVNWIGLKRFLKGALKGEGIWELAFRSEGIQYRVLGYFGPKRKEATLLIGCHHKQRVYDPPGALTTALKRKKMLEQGKATICERKIATDF